MRRGLTLVELLIVIGIVASLGAITYAVSGPARLSGKKSANLGVARNLWLAHSLYRTAYGGDGVYGIDSEMGLPSFGGSDETLPQQKLSSYGAPWPRDWRSACDQSSLFLPRYSDRIHWVREVLEHQESTIFLTDIFCTPQLNQLSQYDLFTGLGVELSGRAFYRVNRGNPLMARNSWWY